MSEKLSDFSPQLNGVGHSRKFSETQNEYSSALTKNPQKIEWWYWPNLLSLDAPLVAIAWMHIFSKGYHVPYLETSSYVLLFVVVWAIYASDRLLDAIRDRGEGSLMRPRHEFHRRYWKIFASMIAGALALTVWLSLYEAGVGLIKLSAWAGLLVCGYFVLAAVQGKEGQVSYAKNFVAGLTFAIGSAIPVFFHGGVLDFREVLLSREVLMFAVLATLNITAIDLWEHAQLSDDEEEQAASELALSFPLIALIAFAVYTAYGSEETLRWVLYSIGVGAGLLQYLNRYRKRFNPRSLRVLADVALILPVFVFYIIPE